MHGDVWKWTSRLLFDFVHVHKGRLNDQRLNDNLKKCILNELLTKICYSVNEKSRYTVNLSSFNIMGSFGMTP